MRDTIKAYLKSLVTEKGKVKAIWKLFYTTVGYISFVFSFVVLIKDLTGFNIVEVWIKEHFLLIFATGVIASLIQNHQKISFKNTPDDDDLQIITTVSDLFCVRASSYVIPTNTFFRTVMEGEYISPQSVQGAFQLKYFKKNRNKLDEAINANLKLQGLVGEISSDNYGIVKKYPIGTVAKVNHKNKHFYFVAINDVNKFGKPINQKYENVEIALNGLIQTINKLGHCDDLAIPPIGTGRAAIREATIEKVIENTADLFLNSRDKVARKLIICISPRDYLDDKVDLKRVEKYISYKCEFR